MAGLYPLAPFLALAGGFLLAACQWLILVYAPTEATLGLPQKIFYLHLPLAWWGLFSFFLVFIASGAYLASRKRFWDVLAGAAAEIGLALAALALISGAIWAKTSWGLWWTWDARLTTTLVMCFIYAGYLVVRGMDMQPDRRARIAAVLGIVAFLDVPLVFFSARLWSYIHPPSISLEPEMKHTLVACIASFALLWLGLLLFRWRLAQDAINLEETTKERLMRRE
ncbi:MAG: cytochrome c biogenesis protein CcsA [Desulfovibrio sp.]|nr:cytochrome c biogenesis protein CcsA [Desulfovibrio sp.]